MNAVYLGTSPYICIWNILQNCAWFDLWTVDLMHTTRLFIPLHHKPCYFWSPHQKPKKSSPCAISKRLRFGNAVAHHLLAGLVSTSGEEPDEPLVLTQFWSWVSSLSRPGRQGPVVRSAMRSAWGYTWVQVITRRQTRQDHWDHTLAHANARAINPMQNILFCVARLHYQNLWHLQKNRFHFPLLDK